MFDELWNKETSKEYSFQTISNKDEIKKIAVSFLEKYYDENDDKDTWFNKIKELSQEFGYAKEVKTGEYKEFTGNMSGLLIAEYELSQKKGSGKSFTLFSLLL